MEDYNDKRADSNLNDSVELIKPVLVNDRKMNFQDLKSEYTKAVSYIDNLRTDKNNLIQTIKLLSNRKSNLGGLTSSASISQLKGTLLSENDKKIVQLEQENRELRKTVSEYKKSREHVGNDRKFIALEQENMELKKTLEMKTDQIMVLQKEAFAQNGYSEIEQLEKNNRQLKKQVDLLNRDIERMTQKLREMEEENNKTTISKETSQTLIKYINYILNTISTFQPGNPMRDCFEERFTSALDVHRLLNSKDYIGILMRCLKFISDILLTADTKTADPKPLSIRNLNVQEMLVSNILENQGIQTSVQKRKSIANNRPNTPLGRSSGSGTLNTSIATNCQTPSNISTQDRRTSAIKKQGRTLSQEISCINNTESHILYGNSSRQQPHHTKNLSLVPDSQSGAQDNMSILNGRRGSKTSRNEDRIAIGNTVLENIISPKVGYSSLEKDRRSKSNLARRNPQNTPLDTSLNDKERFINERENQLTKLDQDLQNKRDKIRDLSRELDRIENKDGDSLASSHIAASGERRGHKRVNTDSCISIRNIESEVDEGYNAPRTIKEEDKSVIRLKPVLKAPSYNNREREYENDYEGDINVDHYPKIEDSTTRSGFGSGYLNPYSTAKDQINDINKKFHNLEMSSRGLSADNRGKSPIRGQRAESRSRLRPETNDELSNYRSGQLDEYEKLRRTGREEDQLQRYTDDDIYQPKILPRPQPKDRLEDVGSTSISNAFSRSKIQSAANIGNPYESITQNRVTFEMGDNMEEDGLLERKSSTRNIGSFRSPVNANLKPKGINYASFQVSFGRTETKDKISPSPQDNRPKSPSIIDVRSKRRIDHLTQTYDVIRGEEIKNK